ncbi:MAG: hypothetical protein K6B14_09275 [Lachnospiraceae bacterium]|nr:hypothetical protein [Lachnospiraceae bacterium]
MKQLVFSVCAMLMVLFFTIPVLSLGDTTARTRKLDDASASVTEEVLQEKMKSSSGVSMDENALKKEMEERIKNRLGEEADISVYVKGADLKKGLLSVKVEEDYKGIGDATSHLETEKTCILEREKMRPLIPVCFYLPDITPDISSTYVLGYERLYRSYELQSGERIRLPEKPQELLLPTSKDECECYRFREWMLLRSDGSLTPYKECKNLKVGNEALSYDGSLYGGIIFTARYEKD